ncbi:FkbM family methyltransferase (plasmid) [Actinacidiphila glaucinigra]|uniref:FkbM family methyltransferase n=1 Tax=Actinacidiphila glaucinigra TaxID=235986 RepID=UPI002DD9A4CB|nr:FkbM family methyltransferase [Actinacidiphila glaucinigra]WSD65821.1 FkbM family methyltransferase [Actinacidiphila glaucinigra]
MPDRAPADLIAALQIVACAQPDASALRLPGDQLTYRHLTDRIHEHTDTLRRQGLAPGALVGVDVARSVPALLDLLAVMACGCAYLPLDPAHDPEQITDRAKPHFLLHDATLVPFSPDEAPVTDGIAYVMPTSGTAAASKLVEVPHQAVLHNLAALNQLTEITPEDDCLLLAPLSFSSSVRQLFLPLLYGACVVVADETQRQDPDALLALITTEHVTSLDTVPSLLALLADTQTPAALAATGLRRIMAASEPIPAALARRWTTLLPESRFFAMYGLTETAGIVAAHLVTTSALPADGYLPIGAPLPGTHVALHPQQEEPGDGRSEVLAVSGPGLARGYRYQQGEQDTRFVTREGRRWHLTGDLARVDEAGRIVLTGRADRQVKVAGKLVDLNAVETALRTHPAVLEAVAVPLTAPNQDPRIHVAVQLRPGHLIDDSAHPLRHVDAQLRVLEANPPETTHMHEEIYQHRVYERHGIVVPSDATVIDAGANIGLFSLSLAQRAARVIAFEPCPPTYQLCAANLQMNSAATVQLLEAALGSHTGTAEITWYPGATGLSTLHPDPVADADTLHAIARREIETGAVDDAEAWHEQATDIIEGKLRGHLFPCRVLRLSDVLDTAGVNDVDLLKIDVQKAEADVLAGIDERHWPGIHQIVAEVHDIDGRLADLVHQLHTRGFHTVTEADPMSQGAGLHYLYARRPGYARSPASPAATPGTVRETVLIDERDLLAWVNSRLPHTHRPAAVTGLARMPRTASGKPDRRAVARLLASSPASGQSAAGHHNADEPQFQAVAALWSEILGRPVAPGQHFFLSGGTSLSAARVVNRLRRSGHPQLSVRALFDHPVLDAFCAALTRSQEDTAP